MHRILIADVPEVQSRLTAVFADHELTYCNTMGEARSAMQQTATFALAIVGMHFDESRMFDLVRLIRADDRHRRIPVICFRALTRDYTPLVLESVEIAAKALGANAFFDFNRFRGNEPDQKLHKIVAQFLDE